ncbi:aldo/keto reductase family oxidoreductase [Macrococcus sp. DPC7161]|uniref:aldo/keto reductase n=1 Tax=Macrococcus sp. DPC7161 TaxID=2507060 RepID=UPI00100A8F44|nr:aldo/keto reductase [Macrococcus sp. DPC7161]RXK17986.1 oxidoreductase [Macrococcus sp. DPC7161]
MEKLELSQVVQGFWRLNTWQMDSQTLNRHLNELVEMGVTSMDHADIYGDYTCEGLFGQALKLSPNLRDSMQIITKCGIELVSKTQKLHDYHQYNYTKEHIEASVERSLKELNINEIDLLLLHRPSPLLNPVEVADTLKGLHQGGKVKHFGVSNFKRHQFDVLQKAMQSIGLNLEYNQVEISPLCLENIEDGTLNDMLTRDVDIMCWSPLAGGNIFKTSETNRVLQSVAKKYETTIDDISYRFINQLPNKIHPIVGSQNIQRTQIAQKAMNSSLDSKDWFEIYKATLGRDIL